MALSVRMVYSANRKENPVSVKHDPDDPESEEEEYLERPACPKCGSTDIRPSRRDSFAAHFFSMFGRLPFRCRSCRVKFYRHAPEQHGAEDV